MLLTAFSTNYYYSNGWSVGRCNPRIYLRANELTYRASLSHQFCLNLFTLSLIYLCSLRLSVTSSKIFRIYKIFYDIAKDHHSIVFCFYFSEDAFVTAVVIGGFFQTISDLKCWGNTFFFNSNFSFYFSHELLTVA